MDDESLDESSIPDKMVRDIEAMLNLLSRIADIVTDYRAQSNTVLDLQKNMALVEKRMGIIRKLLKVALLRYIVLIAIPLVRKAKEEFKQKMLQVAESFGKSIDKAYETIDELHAKIRKDNSALLLNWSMEAANAILAQEARVKDQRIFIEELRKARVQVKKYAEEIKKTIEAKPKKEAAVAS